MEDIKMTLKEEIKQGLVKKISKIPAMKKISEIKSDEMQKEMSEIKIMKKKKRKNALNADVEPEVEEVCIKKKKIVKKAEQTETANVLLEEEPVKDKKKIKKKHLKTECNVEMAEIEKIEHHDIDFHKKKCKKTKKQKNLSDATDLHTIDKKNKKKKKEITEEDNMEILETGTPKKKKNKKSKTVEKETKVECSQKGHFANDEMVKETKDKSRAEENPLKNVLEETDEKDIAQVKKKKHKKTKSERDSDMFLDIENSGKAEDITDVSDKLKHKKKKKKKMPVETDKEPLIPDSESDTKSKRKQKGSSKKEENKIDAEADAGPKKKKNKIKEEPLDLEEPSQVEVVFVSEKLGNTDELNINKERRRALQIEIDQESQPRKPAKPLGLGQWGTAEFGSSEQQQKFLRLMGGLKKGFQPASSQGGGGNMALGKEAQQQLQQGLQGEFERAHSRHMDFNNRGAGIGFTAPSKKKFSIDANMTRSIRFDD